MARGHGKGLDRRGSSTSWATRWSGESYRDWNPRVKPITNIWTSTERHPDLARRTYTSCKPLAEVVERCLLLTTDPGDLVLDPTCGTAARPRWSPRVGSPLDHDRHLAGRARPGANTDHGRAPPGLSSLPTPPRAQRKEAEVSGLRSRSARADDRLRHPQGFVYKRVAARDLGSIAQNPDILEGMSREDIEAAIARHAEHESSTTSRTRARKVVRVTGPSRWSPFTAPDARLRGRARRARRRRETTAPFATTILENLARRSAEHGSRGAPRLRLAGAVPGRAGPPPREFTDAAAMLVRSPSRSGPSTARSARSK